MIHIYEPTCRQHSHEVCNAGFLDLFSKAFPNERIIFYSHSTHILCIKHELSLNNKLRKYNISFKKISFSNEENFWSFLEKYFFFLKEKKKWKKKKNNKIIFLSYNKSLLKILKLLFREGSRARVSLLLVTHGILEEINKNRSFMNPRENFKNPELFFIKLINKIASPTILLNLVYRKTKEIFLRFISIPYLLILPNLKVLLTSFNPPFCRYILHSEHIQKELINYKELKSLNTSVIPMPVIMKNMNFAQIKKKVIFGIIGYGLPSALLKLLNLLDRKSILADYEIRLIGMQPSATLFEKYSKVIVSRSSVNHNILTRSEMEQDIKDVNMQIILYPNNSYELSQSLSIFEALRYNKPIIHINNPCINFYNDSKSPIGLKCQTLEDMAKTIKKLVENKKNTLSLLKIYEKNLISIRKKYSTFSSIAHLNFIYKDIDRKNQVLNR
jgi:hypothetical protein